MSKLVTNEYGTKYWYLNDKLHRVDGPACEYKSGYREWFLNGEYHREDGPAIIFSDGTGLWCLYGKKYTKEEWFKRLTPEQQYNYLWNLE